MVSQTKHHFRYKIRFQEYWFVLIKQKLFSINFENFKGNEKRTESAISWMNEINDKVRCSPNLTETLIEVLSNLLLINIRHADIEIQIEF